MLLMPSSQHRAHSENDPNGKFFLILSNAVSAIYFTYAVCQCTAESD